jgi:hypothetical protein
LLPAATGCYSDAMFRLRQLEEQEKQKSNKSGFLEE